ncbi:MAG: DsbC family protein, partial [Lysobacterales bacterium]
APAAMPGYQEVMVGGQVIYVSNDGRYLVQGSVLDMNTRVDLTEARKVKARQITLATIPANQRISFPAKNEKYKVLVFTDLDCGWCRKMHQQIAEYNNAGITVDYLFFPRAGMEGDSAKQAQAVWCSKDRRAALTQAKAGQHLTGPTNCKNPVADQFNLGMRLGVAGTPTIYSVSGVDMRGYKPPQEMATALAALNAPPAKPAAGGSR